MGTFCVGCLIKNPVNRKKTTRIPRLMVDTGSEGTWIPRPKLEEAGIKAEKRQTFQMANGQWIYRDVGYAVIRVADRETVDEVVFAEPGDYILLGARALEGLMLWVDPREKTLIQIEAHPVAKVIVPGKIPSDKDQLPPFTGIVIQGEGGPVPRAARKKMTKRAHRK
jgi:predicted aspartyl protease